jgi:Dolichyl-phosphate-mannose-protein mannosyltransferase
MTDQPSSAGAAARSTPVRTPERPVLWLFALFLVTLPAVNVRLYASDEVQYFAFLRSLWFDRDLSFDNEYRALYDRGVAQFAGFRETFLETVTETGLRLNFGTLGPAILWAPFYAIADASVVTARLFGAPIERDGYSRPYIAAVCYGSAIYGFLAVLLSVRIARQLTGTSALPAIAIWIGTPLLFYMYLAAGMAHAVSAFTVAAMLAIWMKARERWTIRGALALGAIGGLITMVREQDAVLLAGPLADYLIAVVRRTRDRGFQPRHELALAGAGLSAFAIVYLPQILAYLALNGRPGPSRLVIRKMTWTSPHALEVLFSPEHGFIAWTPIAAFAIAGLFLLLRQDRATETGPPALSPSKGSATPVRPIAAALLLSLAGHVYISGCVESWTVAGAFGQRRFVAITALLVVGLAALWRRWMAANPSRLLMAASLVVMVWWNLGLMALFGTRLMDRQRLELGRNAYDVFVTVPLRAPELAWRYIAQRESFYQAPAGTH